MSSPNSAGSAREQQLLVRTVQQDVELRALRTRVRMLETRCRENKNSADTNEENETTATTTTTTTAAAAAGTTTTMKKSTRKDKHATELMSPIIAEEIIPDPDSMQRQPTHHHTSVVLGTSIYVYGGQHSPDTRRGFSSIEPDMWAFNLERRTWRRTEIQAGTHIRPRTRHAAATYKGSMFIYGGQYQKHGQLLVSNTMHTFSPASGRWFDVPLTPPGEALCDHTSVVVRDTMYIFGGLNSGGRNNIVRGIDLAQRQWLDAHRLNPQIGKMMASHSSSSPSSSGGGGQQHSALADVPAPRSGHSAVTYYNIHYGTFGATVTPSMLVFGGSLAPNTCANDCFLYNYQTNMWSRLFCGGEVPEPRSDHSATCVKEWMFVCGGVGVTGGGDDDFQVGSSSSDDDDDDENEKGSGSDGSDDETSDDGSDDDEDSDENDDEFEIDENDEEAIAKKKERDEKRREKKEEKQQRRKEKKQAKKEAKLQKKKEKEEKRRKRMANQYKHLPPGTTHLFNDVFALNLAQSVWTKIEITTIRPSMLSQCGHSSLIYQSPENYVAMLTFGGVTIDDPNPSTSTATTTTNITIKDNKKENEPTTTAAATSGEEGNINENSATATTTKNVTIATASPEKVQESDATQELLKKKPKLTAEAIEAELKKRNRRRHHNSDSDGEEDDDENASEHSSGDDDDTDSSSSSAARRRRKRKKREEALKKAQLPEHVVDGSIFVMRLISTSSGAKSPGRHQIITDPNATAAAAASSDQHQQQQGGAGGSGSRPTSARSSGRYQRPISATSSRGGGGSYAARPPPTVRPGSAMSNGSNGSSHPRWITTGSHVIDRATLESERMSRTTPKPPTKRSDEEINRFFRGLISRSEDQVSRKEQLRDKYLSGITEQTLRFADEEEEKASVGRLYFDAVQHQEDSKADLEDRFSPRNASKIVEPAVIGEAVERLFSLAPHPSQQEISAARGGSRTSNSRTTTPSPSPSSRNVKIAHPTPDDIKSKPLKKVKKITPQEEKDAVQRLYYLSVEFSRRRQKELADKHLYAGYKSKTGPIDPDALVTRLYHIKERREELR